MCPGYQQAVNCFKSKQQKAVTNFLLLRIYLKITLRRKNPLMFFVVNSLNHFLNHRCEVCLRIPHLIRANSTPTCCAVSHSNGAEV